MRLYSQILFTVEDEAEGYAHEIGAPEIHLSELLLVLVVDHREHYLLEFVADHLDFGEDCGADGLVEGVVRDGIEDVAHAEAVHLALLQGVFVGWDWEHGLIF